MFTDIQATRIADVGIRYIVPAATAIAVVEQEVEEGLVDDVAIENTATALFAHIRDSGLIDELQRGDFRAFVRAINGPDAIDRITDGIKSKTEKWLEKFPASKLVDNVPVVNTQAAKNMQSMLRMGVEGADVRELQALLHRAGYAVNIDGDFGPSTKAAVEDYQKKNGLLVDGIAGPATMNKLSEWKSSQDERPGVPSIVEAVVQTKEGLQGAAITGIGTVIASATGTLKPLTASSYYASVAFTTLTILGVVLAVGGILWTAYGHHRANTTRGLVKKA